MANKNAGESGQRPDSWVNCLLLVLFVFFLFNLWETTHFRFLTERVPGPGGEPEVVHFHGEYVTYGVMAFLLAAAAWAWFRRDIAWKFISSIHLGIVLMSSVLVSVVLGTLVLQNADPQAYVRIYSEPLFALFKAVHLTNLFGSWWFLALLMLLGVNLIACAVKRKPWSLTRLGFILTHFGIVVVIIGGLVGGLLTTDGLVVLREGDKTDYAVSRNYLKEVNRQISQTEIWSIQNRGMMLSQDEQQRIYYSSLIPERIPEEYRIPIGATLELEKFEQLFYDDPFVVNLSRHGRRENAMTGQRQEGYFAQQDIRFDDTRPVVLESGHGVLEIKELYRNFKRKKVVEPSDSGSPLAKVALKMGDMTSTRILGEDSMQNPLELGRTRIRFSLLPRSASELKELGILKEQAPHKIVVYDKDFQAIDQFELGEGDKHIIAGTEYELTLTRFYGNYVEKKETEDDQAGEESDESEAEELKLVDELYGNPALEVEVGGGGLQAVTLTLKAFGGSPHEDDTRKFRESTGLVLQYAYDPAIDLLIIGEGDLPGGGTGPLMDAYVHGRSGKTIAFGSGFEYKPPYERMTIRLEDVAAKAVVKEEISDDAEVENPAVRVEVTRDDYTISSWLECGDTAPEMLRATEGERFVLDLDEKWRLSFDVRGDFRKDWRSYVNLYRDQEKARSHMIRVNEPLVHNGFYFYQQSWYPQLAYGRTSNEVYTYLRVVNDPGLPIVYLGLAMMVVGIIYTLYLRPRLERARKTEEEQYVE
jgi:hypothetical protein